MLLIIITLQDAGIVAVQQNEVVNDAAGDIGRQSILIEKTRGQLRESNMERSNLVSLLEEKKTKNKSLEKECARLKKKCADLKKMYTNLQERCTNHGKMHANLGEAHVSLEETCANPEEKYARHHYVSVLLILQIGNYSDWQRPLIRQYS